MVANYQLILGGSLFGIAGEKKLCGRSSIISIGILFHLFAYGFIFFNIPPESTIGETTNYGFWGEPR